MRRAQVDKWSQPVRNLFAYGNCENLSGGTQTVRTNLANDPRGTSATLTSGASAGYRGTRWFGQPPGAGAYSLITGAVDGPIPELTSYVRKTWTNANSLNNGDTGFEHTYGTGVSTLTAFPITANTIYTISSYIRTSASGKTGAAIQLFWKDAAGVWISTSTQSPTVALVAGVWTRLWITATAPSNAAYVGILSDVDTGTFWAAGDTLDGTGLLIEASTVLGSYFDGNTPAVGDFTYGWLGTTNNSASVQRGQVLSGWNANPGSSNRWVTIASTDWSASGTRSARVIPTSATDGTLDATYAEIIFNNLTIGMRYRAFMTLRLPTALLGTLAGLTRAIVFPGTPPTGVIQASVPPNAAGVWQHWVEFTSSNTFHNMRIMNGAREGNGDLWIDNVMLTEGIYTGDFIDGTKPLSKWDGTANASTSVGYPPQLFDLAGKPSVDLIGVSNTGGVAIPVGAFDARTIYLCYDAWGLTANYPNFGYYGVSGTKGIVFQTAATGSSNLFPRLDFPTGDTNKGYSHVNGRLTRRHVVGISFPTGLASASSIINGNVAGINNFALNPGTGWDDGRAAVSSNVDGTGVRMLVYYAEHDTATKVAISRYLGNKYGANVA